MVTVSTPTKPSSTRRSLRSSSAKSGSATPARKARASHKAQAARPSSGSRSAEETSGAETKIAEPATQKATAEPGRVEEPDKAPDNRTGTLVTTVDKYNDLTGRSVAAITAGLEWKPGPRYRPRRRKTDSGFISRQECADRLLSRLRTF